MPHPFSVLDHLGITQWRLRPTTHATSKLSTEDDHDSAYLGFQAQVNQCQQCALCHQRTHVVFGTGNTRADLMVIGEAPSMDDDAIGQTFLGKIGELLDKMLAAIGQSRHSVYLTHSVKCRPKEDRLPEAIEVNQCLTHLQAQIAFVKPKLILTLGLLPAQSLLQKNTSLALLREHTWSFDQIPLIASFSPNHLFHHPADKRQAFQDLLRTQALLSELIKR